MPDMSVVPPNRSATMSVVRRDKFAVRMESVLAEKTRRHVTAGVVTHQTNAVRIRENAVQKIYAVKMKSWHTAFEKQTVSV